MAGENYNAPEKQTKGSYMDQEWFLQAGMYKVPSLGINMPGPLAEVKAAIREKLEQRESVDPITYINSLLEAEIRETTNQLFEQEFNEGCSGSKDDYPEYPEEEDEEESSKKSRKKKVKNS